MKSQGLPTTMIALIIIAIIFLVIAFFFFSSEFSGGKSSTNNFFDIFQNKSSEAQCTSASFGSCPSTEPYCNVDTGECVASCSSYSLKTCESEKLCVHSCDDCESEPYNCDGNCVSDCSTYCSGKPNADSNNNCVS